MKAVTTKLISALLVASLFGCTSNKSDTPSENQEVADETTSEISDVAAEAGGEEGGDFSEFGSEETVAGSESAESSDAAATEEAAPAEGDQAAAEGADEFGDLQETPAEGDQAATEAPAEGDQAAAPAEGEEDPFADPADSAATTEQAGNDEADPFADPATPTESNLSTEAPAETTPEAAPPADELAGIGQSEEPAYVAPPTQASLKKMETTPYTKNGVLVNAIYVARKGDSLSGISQKIYGSNKTNELIKVNGHLASRDLVVGDKVYYNSPQRPTDDKQLLTFYEDMGLSPEYYVAQDGDNIRTVGKQLLGDSKSWKEIWATNLDVESKDVLNGGQRLRYWSNESSQSAPAMAMGSTGAQEQMPPPQPPQEIPPLPDQAQQQQMAQNEIPPPPPPAMQETQQAAPPPPAQDIAIQEAPPPPPPVEAPKVENPAGANPLDSLMGGDDTTALIAGAVLLLAAVFMVIIIRKRKTRKNIDFHTATHTQLE